MKVCVFGLWHLGSVISSCLPDLGVDTIGLDYDKDVITKLNTGIAPIYEPELNELISKGIRSGKLSFTTDPELAVSTADYIWVAFDTPVNSKDKADISFITNKLNSIIKYFKPGVAIIVSSQVPVGFTKTVEQKLTRVCPEKNFILSYSPENLRLGKAIGIFKNPDRFIIGVRNPEYKSRLLPLLSRITDKLVWMKTESAEMTKHAINSFLASSIVFANELAVLCESVGANMAEVELGLKSEERIGPKAYLSAGMAYSGGTLARDIDFLVNLGGKYNKKLFMINAVQKSNQYHSDWIKRKCVQCLHSLKTKKIAILGLTYKPNTDTLRRSSAIELSNWLFTKKVIIKAYDPYITKLPGNIKNRMMLCSNLQDTVADSDCVIITTQHKQFRELPVEQYQLFNNKIVIDPTGFLSTQLSTVDKIKYYKVGSEPK